MIGVQRRPWMLFGCCCPPRRFSLFHINQYHTRNYTAVEVSPVSVFQPRWSIVGARRQQQWKPRLFARVCH
jgi:hypothetical protein